MKILVYDIAAESGGALSILNNVYDHAKENKDLEWVFILSTVKLEASDNIVVENYPEIKKSWARRFLFDKFRITKIVGKHKPDVLLNLQNICVKCRCRQVLYLHQPLPFSKHKISFGENKRYWFYQNVIGGMIKRNVKRASSIIVQTDWIKRAVVEQCGADEKIIRIEHPVVDKNQISEYAYSGNKYFYPASSSFYKNHRVIIEACRKLGKRGYDGYEVLFTLKGDETDEIKKLYDISKDEALNIEWSGSLPRDEIYRMYGEYKLIFPSFIESFGLPLAEAKAASAPIVAADTEFSREICGDYDRARFFDKDDAERLAELMTEEGVL